jgi:hypothetical protein
VSRRSIFKNLYGLRGAFLFAYKLRVAVHYLADPARHFLRWLFLSREVGNFSYDLTPRNRKYLASVLSVVVNRPYDEMLGYLFELDGDAELRGHIERRLSESRTFLFADRTAGYGRRAGWYAVVRAKKPRLLVETGVDKGLGSCVLAAALLRNCADGVQGRYVGTDINPEAGYLFTEPYNSVGKIVIGDSISSLERIADEIDVFVNDSDHSAEYEAKEYATIAGRLAPGAVILGDNAHVSDKLQEFSLKSGRRFLFFREDPAAHWYRGAGIGFAFGIAQDRSQQAWGRDGVPCVR